MHAKKLIAVLLLAAYMASSAEAIGLGLSPSELDISDALKGGEYEDAIMVYNTNPDEGLFGVSVEGAIQNWTKFYDPLDKSVLPQFRIPAKSQKLVTVKFTIPLDAPNGKYNGIIYASLLPPESGALEEPTQSVMVRMPSYVSIEVTGEQIVRGEVRSVGVKDVEIDYPLRIEAVFYNTGNVIVSPKIKAELSRDGAVIGIVEYDKTPVKPQEMLSIMAEIPTNGMNTGNYTCNVKVFLGNVVLSQQDIKVSILKRGTLTAEGKLGEVTAATWIYLGVMHKTQVSFENTGQMDVKPKLAGEVYDKNGDMLDTVDGEAVLARTGETVSLTAYYKPSKVGDYTIKYGVVYEGKKIPLDSIKLTVKAAPPEETTPQVTNTQDTGVKAVATTVPGNEAPADNSMLLLIGAIILILVIVLLVSKSKGGKKA